MKKIKLIGIIVSILNTLIIIQGQAQTTKYSLDEIKKLIPVVTGKELIESLNKGCVSFKLNTQVILELKDIGASNELINIIDTKYCSDTPNDIIVQIEYPTNNGTVARDGIRVRGSYNDNCLDDIWVFVWPELAPGIGWPQSDNAIKGLPALKENGRWKVYCNFGGPPQEYNITVYTASVSASKIISSTLIAWAAAKDYPGLSEENLPSGLIERYRIKVEKK